MSSPNNDTFEWLIGAFYTHEKSVIDPQNYFATEFGTDTIAPDIVQIANIFLHSKYDGICRPSRTRHGTSRRASI